MEGKVTSPLVPEELSSDELVIDLSIDDKKNKTKSRKRKRNDQLNSSEDDSITQIDGADEIEDNLSSAAAKNNLTSANVKNILKRVVLNEHVLAIVKLREEEIECSDKSLEPKLTRAKTKKLKSTISTVSWPLPITPVKVSQSVSPEVTSLISQDLPDEESDEEYNPNLEDHSEDDKDTLESSDLDSLPQTPATPDLPIQNEKCDSEIKYTDDGIFKIPQDVETNNAVGECEATIALRTRSKLSLSDIPIEKIEESFFPPDITKDMYEFEDCHIDGTWRDFLQEFSKPLSNTNEDDDDGDPEYNAAAETETFDFEELREDADVEVSRKELKDLVEELFNDMDGMLDNSDFSLPNPQIMPNPVFNGPGGIMQDDNTSPVKILDLVKSQENINQPFYSNNCEYNMQNFVMIEEQTEKQIILNDPVIETNITSENNPNEENQPSLCTRCVSKSIIEGAHLLSGAPETRKLSIIEKLRLKNRDFNVCEDMDWYFMEGEINILPEQRLLLNQQMRKHVQLATQCFLQFHAHPDLWELGPKEKEFLMTLKYLGENKPDSAFIPCNLFPAIEVCEEWEKMMSETSEKSQEIFQHVLKESQKAVKRKKSHSNYYPPFHKYFYEIILNSKAFIYPYLLPSFPFRPFPNRGREYYSSEDQLIAMGLEQFYIYLRANGGTGSTRNDPLGFVKIAELICKYMMPFRPLRFVKNHIKTCRRQSTPNPIKDFFTNGKAPKTINVIEDFDPDKCLREHPINTFPYSWQKKLLNRRAKKTHHWASGPFLKDRLPRSDWTIPRVEILSEDSHKQKNRTGLLNRSVIPDDQTFTADSVEFSIDSNILTDVNHVASTPKAKSNGISVESEHLNQKQQSRDSPDVIKLQSKRISRNNLLRRLSHLLFLCIDASERVLSIFHLSVKSTFIPLRDIIKNLNSEIDNITTMLPSMPSILTNLKEQQDPDVSNKKTEPSKMDPGNGTIECVIQKSASSKKILDEKQSSILKPCVSLNPVKQRLAVKAQKELEVNRAMFLTKDPYADDLKETLYAASYLEKVKSRLMSKLENADSAITFEKFQNIMNSFNPASETPSELYRKLECFFGKDYSDLTEEFLTFLTPGQADEVGKFMDHFMLTCMSEFLERLQIYFANKPAQLRKVLWCLEKLTEKSEVELTIESIKNAIIPLLKGNQYLIDWFLQLFPDEKPPDSLVNSGFEIIDSDRISKESRDDLFPGIGLDYETLDIPPIEENYGNESCDCSCHDSLNEKYKNRSRHCLACGMKYIQGRVYIQHGRTLRAVHLNWHESSNGHVDQARRLSAPLSSRQIISRRKATSLDPSSNQISAKNDSDEERISPKRTAKCLRTPTSKNKNAKLHCSRSICKSMETSDQTCNKPSISKDKDEEIGSKILVEKNINTPLIENMINDGNDLFEEIDETENITIIKEEFSTIHEENDEIVSRSSDCNMQEQQFMNLTEVTLKPELVDQSSTSEEKVKIIPSVINKPEYEPSLLKSDDEVTWTRNEDKMILLILRSDMEYEDSLQKIKSLLPYRSLEQIGKRVQNVMTLLNKIALVP